MVDVDMTASVTHEAQRAMDRTVDGLKQAAGAAAAGLRDQQAKLVDGFQRASKTMQDVAAFQRGSLETLVRAGQVYAQGLQAMQLQVVQANQAQLEETFSALRALATVTSVSEAVTLQNSLARSAATRTLSEGAKLIDHSVKLAADAIAPVTARVREAADKLAA